MIARLFAATLIAVLATLSGCASGPNPVFLDAETAVAEVTQDKQVVEAAPLTVAEAQDILSRAKRAENDDEKTHRAQLSLLKVRAARAQARQKNSEERAETLNRKIEELQLDARAREAQDALREAAEAQRRAVEAQRRARELREQAAAERERAYRERARTEVAENRIAVAQDRLTELRLSFAELKPRLTDRGLVLTLGEVLFGFDSATLKPYTQRIMERLAEFLQANPKYTQKIEGHTDSVGTATYNQELSRARAQSVADALLSRGVARDRISVEGFGETRPVASNETATGRRENRRVEVVISQGR